MKFHHLTLTALALFGLPAAGVGQDTTPYEALKATYFADVSMCVTTAIGTCGNFCQPFECTPNYTLVSSGETMVFDVAGAPGTFYLLFAGMAVPGCLPIPGVEGAMATWTPAMTVELGSLEDAQNYDLPCQPATSRFTHAVPTLEPGLDVRFQLLGLAANYRDQPALAFSRATEVRTR